MSQDHNMTRMSIDIPDEEHRKLKAVAALRGVSMKQIILECVAIMLYQEDQLNELTSKVLRESDSDKNVNYHKDLNDLRQKLGIKNK